MAIRENDLFLETLKQATTLVSFIYVTSFIYLDEKLLASHGITDLPFIPLLPHLGITQILMVKIYCHRDSHSLLLYGYLAIRKVCTLDIVDLAEIATLVRIASINCLRFATDNFLDSQCGSFSSRVYIRKVCMLDIAKALNRYDPQVWVPYLQVICSSKLIPYPNGYCNSRYHLWVPVSDCKPILPRYLQQTGCPEL